MHIWCSTLMYINCDNLSFIFLVPSADLISLSSFGVINSSVFSYISKIAVEISCWISYPIVLHLPLFACHLRPGYCTTMYPVTAPLCTEPKEVGRSSQSELRLILYYNIMFISFPNRPWTLYRPVCHVQIRCRGIYYSYYYYITLWYCVVLSSTPWHI